MNKQAQNVDQAEIDKFGEVAHHWWDESSEFAPLHRINPLRLGWIEAQVPLAGKKVLDIGCGGGLLTEGMAAYGADVTGIDLSEAALSVARLHLLESGHEVRYLQESAEQHAQDNEAAYDVVTCMEMLEHVPDPASVVQACGKLVKPGGQVFLSTLNRNLKSWLFAIVGAEYVLRLVPRGTHEHERFIKPAELARYVRGAGLELGEMRGLVYNPLTKIYSLADDVSVNYLLSARRPG